MPPLLPLLLNFSSDVTLPVYLLFCAVVLLTVWALYCERRLRRLLRGKNARSLEDSIASLIEEHKELDDFRQNLEAYLTSVEGRLRRSIQGIHTLRFNPFKGTGGGGNQSFATAFLSERGDGLILSSLYARGQVSIFAKPVKGWTSEYELSEEEKDALTETKRSVGALSKETSIR